MAPVQMLIERAVAGGRRHILPGVELGFPVRRIEECFRDPVMVVFLIHHSI